MSGLRCQTGLVAGSGQGDEAPGSARGAGAGVSQQAGSAEVCECGGAVAIPSAEGTEEHRVKGASLGHISARRVGDPGESVAARGAHAVLGSHGAAQARCQSGPCHCDKL
jgi:hypothetical protein